jgi:fructan beta-fructosidase
MNRIADLSFFGSSKKWLFGYLVILSGFILLACSDNAKSTEEGNPEVELQKPLNYYQEQYRQQFHFSAEAGWMGSPGGLIYHKGVYHLFYQYHADSTVFGDVHWGHAVTKDLISWEDLSVAISSDSLGYILPGSVVFDEYNTSGFGTKEDPPMVAMFTYYDPIKKGAGNEANQTQGLAFSLDDGHTWTKYEFNPILFNQGRKDFRNPKVFWHYKTEKWIMVLAVGDHVEIYGSYDLIDWVFISQFGQLAGSQAGVWESPELFPLTVTGTDLTKWVLLVSLGEGVDSIVSATQYFIGEFDGYTFVNDEKQEVVNWLDYGGDNYAGITFSETRKLLGRTIIMSWMSNLNYDEEVPTAGWRGTMTIPRTLSLVRHNRSFKLKQYPVEESIFLRTHATEIGRTLINGEVDWSHYLKTKQPLLDFELLITKIDRSSSWYITLSNDSSEFVKFGFDYSSRSYYFDRSQSTNLEFSSNFSDVHRAKRLSTKDQMGVRILIDETSIEMFGDMGEVVLSEQVFPSSRYTKMTITAPDIAILLEGVAYNLKSVWK